MIKFQKSQALTSHFESFWSIVHLDEENFQLYSFTKFFIFQGQKNMMYHLT